MENSQKNKGLSCDKDYSKYLKDKNIEFNRGGYPYLSFHRMFFKNINKNEVVDHINQNK